MALVRTVSGRSIYQVQDPQEVPIINGGTAFRLGSPLPHHSSPNFPTIGIPAFSRQDGACLPVGREFDGSLCSCGDELKGLASWTCCFSWLCPCAAFGWNKHRLSGKKLSSVLWAIFFAALVALPFGALLSSYTQSCEALEEGQSCSWGFDLNKLKYRVGATAAISFVLIVAMGTWNRMEVRRKCNIQGSGCGFSETTCCEDLMAWTCCTCCALCQETRTLAHNNVKKGIWNGPEAMSINVQPFQATGIPVQVPNHIQPMEICRSE